MIARCTTKFLDSFCFIYSISSFSPIIFRFAISYTIKHNEAGRCDWYEPLHTISHTSLYYIIFGNIYKCLLHINPRLFKTFSDTTASLSGLSSQRNTPFTWIIPRHFLFSSLVSLFIHNTYIILGMQRYIKLCLIC